MFEVWICPRCGKKIKTSPVLRTDPPQCPECGAFMRGAFMRRR